MPNFSLPSTEYVIQKFKSVITKKWNPTSNDFKVTYKKNIADLFVSIDKNNNSKVTLSEFKNIIKEWASMTDDECVVLFDFLNENKNKFLVYTEMIYQIHNILYPIRHSLTVNVFKKLDKQNLKMISLSDLAHFPSSIDKYKFLSTVVGPYNANDTLIITRDEYMSYYVDNSINTKNDDIYMSNLCDTWKVSMNE